MSADYHGPNRRKSCPVENCGEVQELIDKNKTLSRRITQVGTTSLTVLGLVVAVLVTMANNTMDIAKDNTVKLSAFLEQHNQVMLRDENIHATLVQQMSTTQEQLETVSEIQREVIQEVSILKNARVR